MQNVGNGNAVVKYVGTEGVGEKIVGIWNADVKHVDNGDAGMIHVGNGYLAVQ